MLNLVMQKALCRKLLKSFLHNFSSAFSELLKMTTNAISLEWSLNTGLTMFLKVASLLGYIGWLR